MAFKTAQSIAIDEPDRQLHNRRLLHQVECALQQFRQEQRQAFLMYPQC
ncbi:hypothetical protein LMJ53_01215 [Rheinheimera sp. UJ51]|nr:hypothetical protein [Rheinheimera sp. UJ51]MCC5450355.1 hypothetical protein [Rheinheimera sp. UJ51]